MKKYKGENMQPITYIDNNIQLGILYNWDLIFAAYRALKCPDNVHFENG